MAKLTLNDVTNLNNQTSSQSTINGNSRSIETALENTLSRDGTSPNQLNTDIDMNNFRLLNNPAPIQPSHLVRKSELDALIPDINGATEEALGDIENARVSSVASVNSASSAALASIQADKNAAAASAAAAAASATASDDSASAASGSANSATDSKNAAATSATSASSSASASAASAAASLASANAAAISASSMDASVAAAAASASAASGSASAAASSASAADASQTAAAGSATAASGSATAASGSATAAAGSATAASSSATAAAGSATAADASADSAAQSVLDIADAVGDLNVAASNLTGGTGGQLLAKQSNTNYDYTWVTILGTGDMLSSVYDPTAKGGDAFSQDNMSDGTTNKNFTATMSTKLAGIASGATANVGTVTSVAVAVPTGLSVSGGPITVSGTITLSYTAGYQGYTTTEASKLAGIASGAQVNTVTSVAGKTGVVTLAKADVGLGSVDNVASATLLARANHTGTQLAATISDLGTAALLNSGTSTGNVVIVGTGGLPAIGGGNLTGLTKTQVGLANADNTSDLNKPVSTAQAAAIAAVSAQVRERLTADRTYYIRTDGSDSNDGLVDSAGGAFLTGAQALLAASQVDFNSFTVTIQFGAGTFSGRMVVPKMVGQPDVGSLVINGAGATTILTTSAAFGGTITSGAGAMVTVTNATITNTNSNGFGVQATNGGLLRTVAGLTFGACGIAIFGAQGSGVLTCSAGFTITANSQYVFRSVDSGILSVGGSGVIAAGTRTFTATVQASDLSRLTFQNLTWTGTITGKRYEVALNGLIQTYGGGASFFPGSVAGTTATGGQYA